MKQLLSHQSLEISGRRKVYLYAMPAGILTLGIGIIANLTGFYSNPFDLIAQPIFVPFLLAHWYFFAKGEKILLAELTLLSGLFLYFNSSFAYALSYPANVNVAGEIAAFAIWSIGIYCMTFWIFGSRLGQKIATFYFMITVILSLSIYIPSLIQQQGLDELYYIIQVYVGTGLIIIINAVYSSSLESRHKVAQEMTIHANTDVLTQLSNRRHLEDKLALLYQQASQGGQTFSIVLLDIDHFKKVNDVYGHSVGDSVLQQLSRLLQADTRQGDIVGRWGGEEFMIILPHTTLIQAQVIMDRLRNNIEKYTFHLVVSVTASLGVTEFKVQDTLDLLLARADQALYEAKQHGRNQVRAA